MPKARRRVPIAGLLLLPLACRSPERAPVPEVAAVEVDEVEDPAESSVSASEVPIRLAGRVTDSSRVPITGAEVRMSYLDPLESHFLPSAVSLADGSFVLEAARPGHVELWIWSPRHGESQPVHLFLSPGGRRSGLELGF